MKNFLQIVSYIIYYFIAILLSFYLLSFAYYAINSFTVLWRGEEIVDQLTGFSGWYVFIFDVTIVLLCSGVIFILVYFKLKKTSQQRKLKNTSPTNQDNK